MIRQEVPLRVYIDSNVFIYAVEGNPALSDPIKRLFDVLRTKPRSALTSEFTLAEVLAKADPIQRRRYLSLMVWNETFDLRPVSRDILIETATYRKMTGASKLADAIHVVTAIQNECRVIVSADLRMKVPTSMAVLDPTTAGLSSLIAEFS